MYIQSTIISNDSLQKEMRSLLDGETNWIANCSNFSSLLFYALKDINWCGFYILDADELVLGPFQGKPACIRIPMQKGVCGTAAYSRKTIIVDDVNEFPGHIACDVDSRSEIVIPLEYKGRLLGVLDIDSSKPARFTEQDAIVLQHLCSILIDNCSWPEF